MYLKMEIFICTSLDHVEIGYNTDKFYSILLLF